MGLRLSASGGVEGGLERALQMGGRCVSGWGVWGAGWHLARSVSLIIIPDPEHAPQVVGVRQLQGTGQLRGHAPLRLTLRSCRKRSGCEVWS